ATIIERFPVGRKNYRMLPFWDHLARLIWRDDPTSRQTVRAPKSIEPAMADAVVFLKRFL
ncbi:hypothetical protein, partial [Candidatus Entotheonella palauensis]|uniref:hypothetical protein n=1 Tax=Candidatus Entotheonella palauensis TaxID=93172 RepID=UPI001C4E0C7F